MSLFPAYVGSNIEENPVSSVTVETTSKLDTVSSWLNNSSFDEVPNTFENFNRESNVVVEKEKRNDNDKSKFSLSTSKKRKKSKKKKKNSSKTDNEEKSVFTGREEYYVDKKFNKAYLNKETLYKPVCPRYYYQFRVLGGNFKRHKNIKFKRYYKNTLDKKNLIDFKIKETYDEEYFTEKSKEFNIKLRQNPKNFDEWIELVKLQKKAPIKCTSIQLAEKQIEILDRALIHNTSNSKLYEIYIEILNGTYPSFEVSKFLQNLINKDSANYILWNSQILSVQGSMARCIVPDVLKLYEECMQKMYRKSQDDETMLKLFRSCALFLRQSGLSEQFFALIKLALELNVSVDKFHKIEPSEEDQMKLIEYEELILSSGLPMNEIWIRIEKIRQNYNFLPCPPNTKCSDPQRIIFNEDICYFIYPLGYKENCFQLILIILKLLKIPLVSLSQFQSDNFLFQPTILSEFDAIEDISYIFSHQTTGFIDLNQFDKLLFDVMKELTATGPSFMHTGIGNEIYSNTVIEILLTCAECFTDDERKRQILILIWLRFERILIILKKLDGKSVTTDEQKQLKSKIKQLFKLDKNRNVLNFYTEYALIEYEFGNYNVAEEILRKSIFDYLESQHGQNSDISNAVVVHTELLLKQLKVDNALHVLVSYALNKTMTEKEITGPKKVIALQKITERLTNLLSIEKNVSIMDLEQYFLPDFLINLIKIKSYIEILLNYETKLKTMADIEKYIKFFIEKNSRSQFLREHLYEFYLKTFSLNIDLHNSSSISGEQQYNYDLSYEICKKALCEFPYNLYILKCCATLTNYPWYRVKSLLNKSDSVESVIFQILSIRYRFINHIQTIGDDDGSEEICNTRIGNLLKEVLAKSSKLRKNPILWRLHLRILADLKMNFEKSKNVLFSALDEIPWIKALYLDGSVYVPQELSQLQDLIIEKQLRINALPEELEILRSEKIS